MYLDVCSSTLHARATHPPPWGDAFATVFAGLALSLGWMRREANPCMCVETLRTSETIKKSLLRFLNPQQST
jgi:hypothetical protein